MKKYSYLYFFLLLLFVNFCEKTNKILGPDNLTGNYTYTAFDSTNKTTVIKGWFKINVYDTTKISGEWHFQKVGNPQNVGPQVGDGQLIGELQKNQIFLELNPQFRDNNVGLIGETGRQKLKGQWHYSGFPGPINWGYFEAVKN
jgi:hypothetical protein